MDAPLILWVEGDPVPQPRQKFGARIIRGKPIPVPYGFSKNEPISIYKEAIRRTARAAYSGPLLEGPLSIDILAVHTRPKAMRWKTRPMPREWLAGNYDVDNVMKAIMDALTGIWWKDDRQIADSRCRKLTAAGHEGPHIYVRVAPIVAVDSEEPQPSLF